MFLLRSAAIAQRHFLSPPAKVGAHFRAGEPTHVVGEWRQLSLLVWQINRSA
jgi:hypothetical protein